MTVIEIKRGKGRYAVRAEGHAGDERVCAALSALVYTLGEGFSMLERRGKGKILTLRAEKGSFEIEYYSKSREADAVFRALEGGLHAVGESYPENVKIINL